MYLFFSVVRKRHAVDSVVFAELDWTHAEFRDLRFGDATDLGSVSKAHGSNKTKYLLRFIAMFVQQLCHFIGR